MALLLQVGLDVVLRPELSQVVIQLGQIRIIGWVRTVLINLGIDLGDQYRGL